MPNGKICYVEIPASDVDVSAQFYSSIFGWNTRMRGDGSRAFDDATGDVSGTWIAGRRPAGDPGMVTYIMVDSIEATLEAVVGAGGDVVRPRSPLPGGDAFATFRDPAGNVIGLYQQPRR